MTKILTDKALKTIRFKLKYEKIYQICQKLSLFGWFLSKMKVAASVFILNLFICYVLSSNTTYILILRMNTNATTFVLHGNRVKFDQNARIVKISVI